MDQTDMPTPVAIFLTMITGLVGLVLAFAVFTSGGDEQLKRDRQCIHSLALTTDTTAFLRVNEDCRPLYTIFPESR